MRNLHHFTLCVLFVFTISIVFADDGQDSDRVTYLPGFGPLHSTQFAGYLPVNEEENGNLFYWFIAKNSSTPSSTIVWINGGQGCTSFIGAFGGIGPHILRDVNGTFQLTPNPYSWSTLGNILFIDQPVGTGYSTSLPGGLARGTDQIAEQVYSAICAFFNMHPQYSPTSSSPLFIAGDSYGGKYIPRIAARVSDGGDYTTGDNTQATCVDLKLNGIAIGNGYVDPYWQLTASPEQAYTNGFIGTYQLKQGEVLARKCQQALVLGDTQVVEGVQHPCEQIDSFIHTAGGNFSNYDLRKWGESLDLDLISSYMNSPEVREALHVESQQENFTACSEDVRIALSNDTYISQMDTVSDLLGTVQLRILFYSGQFDMEISTLSTTRWLRAMNWGGKAAFAAAPRLQWYPYNDGQVGGYIESSLGLYFLTIVQAGHLVVLDQPELAYKMMEQFIKNEPFASDPQGTFTNQLCSYFDSCGEKGTCVQGRCVCNTGYTGYSCSYPINEVSLLVNETFTNSSTLEPYTWDYFSFHIDEKTDFSVQLNAIPSFSIYLQKETPPSLDDFDMLVTLADTHSQTIRTSATKGDWYLGVYNSATIEDSFSIIISRNDTLTNNIHYYDYSSEETSEPTQDIAEEKSFLVWVVTGLSILLLACLILIAILIFIVVKQSSSSSDSFQLSWQNDL